MEKKPNIITVQEAAKEKYCTPQALYKALAEGRLYEVRMGAARLILKNKEYRNFKARGYAEKRRSENHQSREE